MRKIITLLTTLALSLTLTISGITGTQVASATANQNIDFAAGEDIQGDFVLNDNSVFVWGRQLESGTYQLFGYHISADGILGPKINFDTYSEFDYAPVWNAEMIQLKNGKLVFAWNMMKADGDVSTIKLSTSQDGDAWTTAIVPVADYHPAVGKCPKDNGHASVCGYQNLKIAQDGKGTIGLAFTTVNSSDWDVSSPVSVVTSTNLTKWGKPVVYRPTISESIESYIPGFVGLPAGGFGIVMGGWGQLESTFVYGNLLHKANKFTSLKKVKEPGTSFRLFGDLLSLGTNKYLQLFTGGPSSGDQSTFGYITFDAASKKWSTLKQMGTTTGYGYEQFGASGVDPYGNRYVSWFAWNWEPASNADTAKVVLSKIPAGGGPQPAEPVAAGSASSRETVIGIGFDSVANPVIYKVVQGCHLVSQTVVNRVAQDPVTLSSIDGQQCNGFLDKNGNLIFRVRDMDQQITHWTRFVPDETPKAKGLPAVTGKAKVKGKLSVSTVAFQSRALVSPNAYQWYSCETAVTTALFNSVPNTCTAIPGAIEKTYTVTESDIGYYLTATASGTNFVGTTQVLAKTTARVAR